LITLSKSQTLIKSFPILAESKKTTSMTNVTNWMSWESGIDLVAVTAPYLQMPNVIVHLGCMVNTPAGNAPSGMIFWQPNPAALPEVMGFVSTDETVGKYFGPHIFADTPFENAPI